MDQEFQVVDWSSLPEDLWYHILTWVSFPSINSCRRINNIAWHRMTNESNFVALHLERTKTVSGYFVQHFTRCGYTSTFVPFKPLPPSIPTPSLKFLPQGTKILSSSQLGILCCESSQTRRYRDLPPRYCICNPTTQQYSWLPSPKTRFRTQKMTIVASHVDGKLHYKIVRLSNKFQRYDFTICEIFDSKAWRWSRYGGLKKIPYLMLHSEPGVELDNVVYWIKWNNYIFAFDVNREIWKEIALPEWEKEEKAQKKDKLVVVCGELCLARNTHIPGVWKHYIEIWKMVDEGKWQMIWHKRETLLNGFGPVCDFYTSQVWFFADVWMDLGKREITHHVGTRWFSATDVFKHESAQTKICSFDTRMD